MNWKEIVQNYIHKNADKVIKTTKPLHDHFGIQYFTYHKIDHDGHYNVLVDRPDWAEHYVESEFYQIDPFLRDPASFESEVCFMDAHGSEKVKSFMRKEHQEFFKSQPGLIIIEKQKDSVEFFGFVGNYNNKQLQHLYINNLTLLKKFCHYFKNELRSPLSAMQRDPILLPHLKGDDYYFKPSQPEENLHQFLIDIGMESEVRDAAKLSSREKDCLKQLLEGKSAKETAATLFISPRTVETHHTSIKNKLDCWNKGDLFAKAAILAELKLL